MEGHDKEFLPKPRVSRREFLNRIGVAAITTQAAFHILREEHSEKRERVLEEQLARYLALKQHILNLCEHGDEVDHAGILAQIPGITMRSLMGTRFDPTKELHRNNSNLVIDATNNAAVEALTLSDAVQQGYVRSASETQLPAVITRGNGFLLNSAPNERLLISNEHVVEHNDPRWHLVHNREKTGIDLAAREISERHFAAHVGIQRDRSLSSDAIVGRLLFLVGIQDQPNGETTDPFQILPTFSIPITENNVRFFPFLRNSPDDQKRYLNSHLIMLPPGFRTPGLSGSPVLMSKEQVGSRKQESVLAGVLHAFSPESKNSPLAHKYKNSITGTTFSLGLMQSPEATNAFIDEAVTLVSIGDRGDEVRLVQEKLKQEGIDPGPIDGIYGTHTEEAVIRFQQNTFAPEECTATIIPGVIDQKTKYYLFG